MIFCSNNETPPTTPERTRTAAQQEERNQRIMNSPEQHRIPDRSFPPAPVYVPPPPAPAPAPIATTSYNNLPPDLAQQLANLPDFPKPGRHGRPRKNIHAPALAPAPAPAPAPLSFAQLTAQYAALQPVCLIFYLYLK